MSIENIMGVLKLCDTCIYCIVDLEKLLYIVHTWCIYIYIYIYINSIVYIM